MIGDNLIIQTYNDGLVYIHETVADAAKTIQSKPKVKLFFAYRTVGVTRYYAAQRENENIAYLLRCPLWESVKRDDIAILNGEQFSIKLIQYPQDVTPKSMDLTLEAVRGDYAIAEEVPEP